MFETTWTGVKSRLTIIVLGISIETEEESDEYLWAMNCQAPTITNLAKNSRT